MARILVVDDEEDIRRYYTEELSDDGHQVSAVATGHELLGVIDPFEPDVVVLDIKLVDYDGLELLKEIRNEYYNLPVILCSAHVTYKYDLGSIGADFCVVKSFDLSELKAMIRRALEPYTRPFDLNLKGQDSMTKSYKPQFCNFLLAGRIVKGEINENNSGSVD
jgi:DNA-binding response OmpR family regulator